MTRYFLRRCAARTIWPVLAAVGVFAPVAASAQAIDESAFANLSARFGSADANGDGAVSRAEFVAYRAGQWSRLDRDGDGFISRNDLPRFVQSRWDGERAMGMRRYYDRDQDGRISRQEYLGGPTPAFDRADANHDDAVTKAEMNAAAREARR